VRDLVTRDPPFATLCREYRQTEEELLTRIEGYTPA
jgi:hypothetical protein